MKINKMLVVVLAVVVATSLILSGALASGPSPNAEPVAESTATVSAATNEAAQAATEKGAEEGAGAGKPPKPPDEPSPICYLADEPPIDYESPVLYDYDEAINEKDLMVPMRDDVSLSVNVVRPDTEDPVPVLLAMAGHNKELQIPEYAGYLPPQPAWTTWWMGVIESGDTEFLVTRGYAHVMVQTRGRGKSEGGGSSAWDSYDVIEWIAEQPWCDGNVGMIGISAYASAQIAAAVKQPPHLKAIAPLDPGGRYRFHDGSPGGMSRVSMSYMLGLLGVRHTSESGPPGDLPPEQEAWWEEAMENPDYKAYPNFYGILTQKGQIETSIFNSLINPYATAGYEDDIDEQLASIDIPVYTGTGWYAYLYKTHLLGACSLWAGLDEDVPKKLMFTSGPAHLERPFNSYHQEILSWYDYWLKDIDTGIMDEPAVKMWVTGANKWLAADDWPIPETQWTELYLNSWERLRCQPFPESSRKDSDFPDSFVQMPLILTNEIQKVRYMTDPLPQDTVIAGPMSLTLYASIDKEDTNWIVILKDVGPDYSALSAREGEWEIPSNLPETEIVRGWLKASHRALDPERTTPWRPWHEFTREAQEALIPGEIYEYQIEILPSAHMFKEGHRICVDITSMDKPTGQSGITGVEYIVYHICSGETVLHNIYHNEEYPSHLLLPVIPADEQQWIE